MTAIPIGFKFQSTRPHGARPCQLFCPGPSGSFNPRARTGRDHNILRAAPPAPVSIHAPARGATVGHHRPRHEGGVSIHAPARGATADSVRCEIVFKVSIHAPARGATLAQQRGKEAQMFQSTRPHGARHH